MYVPDSSRAGTKTIPDSLLFTHKNSDFCNISVTECERRSWKWSVIYWIGFVPHFGAVWTDIRAVKEVNSKLKQRQRWPSPATKKSLKNGIRAASNLIALIPFCLIRQVLVNFIAVELKKIVSKFRKRKIKLCSRTRQNVKLGRLSSCSRATTVKKCPKKQDARAKLLFCQSKPIGFLPFLLPSPPLPNIYEWGLGSRSPSPLGQPLRHDVWCVWTTCFSPVLLLFIPTCAG